MAICEKCRAELDGRAEKPPAPWFDAAKRAIAGRPIEPMLWQLLELMWDRRDKGWFSTDQAMALLYGDRADDPPSDQIINVHICKLRELLGPTPYAIVSKWREGWMIVERSLIEVKNAVTLGEPEDGVRRQPNRPRGICGQDKYGFRGLKVGQSRVVNGTPLINAQAGWRGR